MPYGSPAPSWSGRIVERGIGIEFGFIRDTAVVEKEESEELEEERPSGGLFRFEGWQMGSEAEARVPHHDTVDNSNSGVHVRMSV